MTVAAYHDHPIRAQVKQMDEILAREDLLDSSTYENETYRFARDKAKAIIQMLRSLLEQTPAELASFSALSSMHSNLQQPFNELTAFVTNNNPGHISNAASYLEQNVQSYFWGLPVKNENDAIRSFPLLLRTQAESSEEFISRLKNEKIKLVKEIEETTSSVKELQSRLDAMEQSAARERAEAAAAVANLQKDFAENETARAAKFEKSQNEYKDAFKEDNDAKVFSAQQILINLHTLREEASNIVQIIGNIGVTGNYQRIAENEGKQANTWRWITIGIFALGISAAIATFIKFWEQPLSPDTLWSVAIRLLYAIAITAPAWYTARESARHRTNSDRARQTELELASIGPFIELMPEEKKIEIKEALTKCYFGRSIPDHQAQTTVDSIPAKDVIDALKSALTK